MKTDAMMDVAMAGRGQPVELLSVDADAHLEKLTAHALPSPALLPVELVRAALKRKATAIDIRVQQERIVISDNGVQIAAAEWQALACLADSRQAASAREKAMAAIQELAHPGIGLLAVFLPGARRIEIETAGALGKATMRIENGRSELRPAGAGSRGTRITIRRRRGPTRQERSLLCELCAAVEAALTVQGQPVKKKPLLADNLVSMRLNGDDFSGPSRIAVPVRGDVCRTWLLDQGIPWQVTAAAPAQGFVFAAALETAKPLTPILLETLSAASARLYHWLAENYIKFPEHLQLRIEDLFFRQAHAGGDPGLLSRCAPFRVWHSQRRLTLDEIRRKAENHELYSLDTGDLPAFFRDREKEVLRLTRTQKDFLVNFLHLPIIQLDSQQEMKARPQRIRAFGQAVVRFARKLGRPAKFRIIAGSCLSHEENRLCRELEIEWQRRSPRVMTKRPLAVAMIAGRGMVPARRLNGDANELLLVRRRHPLTLCALQRIGHDPRNVELAFSALMPDRLLTADE